MNKALTVVLAIACAGGCSADPADGVDCVGDNCDEAGDSTVESCFISSAFGREEHWGSAYQYNRDGDNLADSEKSRVVVTRHADGELTLRIGNQSFDGAVQLDPSEDDDVVITRYEVDAPSFGGRAQLHVFDDNQVGIVGFDDDNDGNFSQSAELDCNPNNAPFDPTAATRFDDPRCEGAFEDANGACHGLDGRFVPAACCDAPAPADPPELEVTDTSFRCTVVFYDESSAFDSAVGTPYTFDRSGERLTEDGHWDVRFRTSEFSDHEDGLSFNFGGLSMNDAGDQLTFVGDTAVERGGATRIVKTWRFSRAGAAEDNFNEVRIFMDSGAGLLSDSFDAFDAAQLDCRSTYVVADELDF